MFWKLKNKIKMFFQEEIFSYFGPKMIRISPIGYACTNACPMCWRVMKKITQKGGLKDTELRWNQYERLLDSLSFVTSTIEVVGGGEPLLFPQIEKLLIKIKLKKLFGSLITNGVVLTPKISAILVENKWNEVRVSINAGSKTIYPLVNGSHYFDRVVKNVKNLVSLRGKSQLPKIGLHFVLQKSNYKDVENFINLALEVGVDQISFDTLISDSPKALSLTNREIEELKKQLKNLSNKYLIKNNIDEILNKLSNNSFIRNRSYFSNKYCQIVQSNLDISSEGVAVPCCLAYDEKIAEELGDLSINQIWKKMFLFRKKLKQGKFENFCYKKCNYSLKER